MGAIRSPVIPPYWRARPKPRKFTAMSPPPQPVVVGIAGGSGSGKTTVARAVVAAIGTDRCAYVQHDAYYRHLGHLPLDARHKVNFDHPDSLETELLVEHLAGLRTGRAVDVPVYDFATHTRTGRTVTVPPCPLVVLDGILLLADAALRDQLDLSVFVDTEPDVRLMRRLERDIEERGRTLGSVLTQYEETVRPMHLEFVEPSKRHADLIVGGSNEHAIAAVLAAVRSALRSARAEWS